MNNVWIFGDSYAEAWHQLPLKNKQWQHIVADTLKYNLHVTGLGGTGLEYTYAKFDEVRHNIKKNDIVIICLTDIHRKWFFEKNPDWGNISIMMSEKLTSDQYKAIKTYYTYLSGNDEFLALLHLKNFLCALHYITEKLELKTIVITNYIDTQHFLNTSRELFPLFRIPNRTMYDVAMEGELTNDFFKYWHKNNHDPRPGHITRSNHIIMADKLLRNIQHNEPLDFSNEFIENNVGFDKEHNKEWCDYELFGQEWKWEL